MIRENTTNNEWYQIADIDTIDSPALVVYRESVFENIKRAVAMAGDVRRLRPHVKTHKTIEVSSMLMDAGVGKFKCATIAEAEMLGMAGAADVLLAYQPVGPKLKRLIHLIQKYPGTKFSCLVDNWDSAKNMEEAGVASKITIPVYLDLNVGMNRTGITPGEAAIKLYKACGSLNGIYPVGFHAYDGHIRNHDVQQRAIECDRAFKPVLQMRLALQEEGYEVPVLVAGGSPSFPIHAKKTDRECSPGTFVFWDRGYEMSFKEQYFLTAAVVISRVISLPTASTICLDLGHKSVAAENTLDKRVYFLNAPDLKFTGQSEEHLVAEVKKGHLYKPGDVLYGLPYHICPTVALYERALVIKEKKVFSEWKIIGRDRKISV